MNETFCSNVSRLFIYPLNVFHSLSIHYLFNNHLLSIYYSSFYYWLQVRILCEAFLKQ